MYKLVFDTSALISLEVANLMSMTLETFRVFASNKVEEELKEVAKYEDVHGKAANRILRLERIEIREVGEISRHLTYVDEGEAEALELARCLCEEGMISMEDGWSFIERIRERRTWGDNIIYRTAKMLWGREEHRE
jgi:predicted nucleic acid-binding protein